MKYVKENMTLVICGAVVLLVLLYTFVPIPGFSLPASNDGLSTEMQNRYSEVDSIKRDGTLQLKLGPEQQVGVPSDSWVKVKKESVDRVNDQRNQLLSRVEGDNAGNHTPERGQPQPFKRLDRDGMPMLPTLPAPVPVAHLLPVKDNNGDPSGFKSSYQSLYHTWTEYLIHGSVAAGANAKVVEFSDALPPLKKDIDDEWDAKMKRDAINNPAATMAGGGAFGAGAGTLTPEQQKARNEFVKSRLAKQVIGEPPLTSGLWMYVEPTAFQRPAWAELTSNTTPDEPAIFEALVTSWLEFDVVQSIVQTNAEVLRNAKDKNVGNSAIKRLVGITVGSNASKSPYYTTAAAGGMAGGVGAVPAGDPGMLFVRNSNPGSGAASTGTGGGVQGPSTNPYGNTPTTKPSVLLPAAENATDYSMGMTGRSAGATYDVINMSVVMDIDPAYLLVFEDKFLRQNPGYTIVNTQFHMVDPMERASNGYLYGETQVISVNLLIECVLYRKWTTPLMPEEIKIALGGVKQSP